MFDSLSRRSALFWVAGLLTLSLALITVRVTAAPEPNRLAAGLLQGFTLILGIGTSYLFGLASAKSAAEEMLRPHARSAFRRVVALFEAFQRLGNSIGSRTAVLEAIAEDHDGMVPIDHVRGAMDLLLMQVFEQTGTAGDAIEDWRDLVPSEVAAIEAQARERAAQ